MFVREKKLKSILLKVSDSEKETIQIMAKNQHVNMSEFIMELVNEKYVALKESNFFR